MVAMRKKLPFNARGYAAVFALVGATATAPVSAQAMADPLIDGARQCTQYFPVEEKKNSIPTHLLAAIATTESGRYHKTLGMNVPWPWTINVEGKGYYFDSKAEAIAQTQNYLARGYRSIDVGCMQVNLKHHPKAFANLNQAFDPATNVAYSAKFLRENYASFGDWIKATAAYHSRTPVHGQRYLGEIERSWNRIVGKVAQARATKAGGGNAPQSSAEVSQPAPRVVETTQPRTQARRARVIQVTDTPRRSSEVMVVRAAPTMPVSSGPLAVAVADAPAPTITAPEGSSIRRVSLDNAAASSLPVAKPSGPQFVFAN
jgi:hypothetical protein